MTPSPCPDCGTTVWEAIEFSGNDHSAVEVRKCERGHEWTEVLTA